MSRGKPEPGGEILKSPLAGEVAGLLGVTAKALAGWEINRIREDGAIDANIPLDQMDVAGVPTDPKNVKRLVGLFDERAEEVGGTGQRDPIVVGHVPGDGFYVLDGFHRHETQTQRSVSHLHSTVEPNLTYDQVVQRRLEYAHTHPEIEFARQVEWVQSAWDRTQWSETMPSVLTAFRAFQDDYAEEETPDVEVIDNLEEDVYEQVRTWVATQSRAWGLTPRQIRENLAKVEMFNRDLLPLVYKGPGQAPAGRIGLSHVEVITGTYAGEVDIQQAVVDLVVNERLNAGQTASMIRQIEDSAPMTPADVRKAAKKIDFVELKGTKERSRPAGFGNVSSGRVAVRAEVEVEPTVSAMLSDMRGRLPEIQADAEEGNWGAKDKDNALEISLVFAEILAQATEQPPAKSKKK